MSDPCQYVISTLEDHSSRLNKEAIILAQAEQANDEFFEGCRLALDPMITFGLKQIPEKIDEDGSSLPWNDFISFTNQLRSRDLTGNAARDAVLHYMKQSTKSQWNNWYRRILIKDLRCGVSEKTINKVVEKKYSNYAVPIFSCQLSHDSANHENKVKGKKQIEVKLDGVRVITILYKDRRAEMFSRNGKQFHNFEHIIDQLAHVVQTYGIAEDMVLDGEVMSSSFQDLMKQVHRKENVTANDAVLHLFDMLTLKEFLAGGSLVPQYIRSGLVKDFVEKHQEELPHLTCLSWEDVDLNTPEGQSRFKDINKQAIDGGYEGIMIKDPKAGYECKRTHHWLKMKPFIEVSLTVVGIEEGTGRNQGKLGAFICEGVDDGKHIKVNVGSGFTDEHRMDYWISRDEVLGKIVEIRADAATKNQDSEETWSLRFPRFLRFRGFEAGEKL